MGSWKRGNCSKNKILHENGFNVYSCPLAEVWGTKGCACAPSQVNYQNCHPSHCHLKHFIVDKSGYNFCWYMFHIIRCIRIHVTVGGFNKRVLKAEHSQLKLSAYSMQEDSCVHQLNTCLHQMLCFDRKCIDAQWFFTCYILNLFVTHILLTFEIYSILEDFNHRQQKMVKNLLCI